MYHKQLDSQATRAAACGVYADRSLTGEGGERSLITKRQLGMGVGLRDPVSASKYLVGAFMRQTRYPYLPCLRD